MTSEHLSSDFNYKKYSLQHLEEWMHDTINCEDLTPQDIYDTIVNVVDSNIEYHKCLLTKNIEVLSLLKGQKSVNFDVNDKDWEEFWEGHDEPYYTEEELDAMCDAAAKQAERDQCREYNMREAEYYTKRAELDAKHSKYYYDMDRNK